MQRLGDLVDVLSGFAFESERFADSGDLPIARIRDVLPGRSSTFYRGEFDEKFVINDGDVLIGMDGQFNRARWHGGRALLNQRVCRIASAGHDLEDDYLFHFLPKVLSAIEGSTPFVTVKHLSAKQILGISIPLPPPPEQRRIAEMLNLADALRAKRRAALAQLDTVTQSIFLDMFGDPESVLGRWPTAALGRLLEFMTSGSRGWAEHYAASGDLFLRIQNVRRDELLLDDVAFVRPPDTAEARRTRVLPGDVLLSITADLGRTAVMPVGLGPAFINQHLSILRTQALVPRFLSAYLTSPAGQSQVLSRNRQGVKAGLNFDDIRSIVVPLPPMGAQDEFSRRIAAVERLKTGHRASLVGMDSLFTSLQVRAFAGAL